MRSYFGEGSMFWKIWRERVQLLGAGRAIILQLSHPLVSAGVGDYSNFQSDPLGRLNRTLDTMLAIVFSDKEKADKSLSHLARIHKEVKGSLSKNLGKFKKGTKYSAGDAQLKLWVHATLMDTGLKIYQTFVGNLSKKDREKFYEESKQFALLMDIPEEIIPKTFDDFEKYMDDMLRGGIITKTFLSIKQVSDILNPKLPVSLRPLLQIINPVTLSLLPESLREKYGFRWKRSNQLKFEQLCVLSKLILPVLPSNLRFMPQYVEAFKKSAQNSKGLFKSFNFSN